MRRVDHAHLILRRVSHAHLIRRAFAAESAKMQLLSFAVAVVVISLVSCTDSKPSVKILVVGKTGSGKSTLINGLLGVDVADVGHSLKSQTRDVECHVEPYEFKDEKFKVTICDSPGFRDTKSSDQKYMEMLQSKCPEPDLVLFVVSMRETRWTDDQVETVTKVNKALGEQVWQNTVLVLTFANEVKNTERVEEFRKEFMETLENIGIRDVNITVALAGDVSESLHLPEHKVYFWFTRLFMKSLQQVKKKGTDAVLLLILFHKDRIRLTEDMKEIFCNVVNNKASKFFQW